MSVGEIHLRCNECNGAVCGDSPRRTIPARRGQEARRCVNCVYLSEAAKKTNYLDPKTYSNTPFQYSNVDVLGVQYKCPHCGNVIWETGGS